MIIDHNLMIIDHRAQILLMFSSYSLHFAIIFRLDVPELLKYVPCKRLIGLRPIYYGHPTNHMPVFPYMIQLLLLTTVDQL